MKKSLLLMVFAAVSVLAADEINPLLQQEIEEPLHAGQRTSLKLMLRTGRFSVTEPLVQPAAKPLPSDSDRKQGFIIFSRSIMRVVNYNTIPEPAELNPKEISAVCCPGEYESLAFGLLPLENSKVTVRLPELKDASGNVLPAACFQVRPVKYMVKSILHGILQATPEMMPKENPVTIYSGVTRNVWLYVDVPENQTAGVYSGEISLKAEGREEAKLGVRIEVLPFRLISNPNMSFGWYRSPVDDIGVADYKRHGCSNFALAEPKLLKASVASASLDFSRLDAELEIIKKHGLGDGGVFTIGAIGFANKIINDFGQKEFSPGFNSAYKNVLSAVRDWAAARKIRLIFWLLDEPRESMIAAWNRNLADTLAYAKLAKEVEGIRTEIDVMRDKDEGKDYTAMIPLLDICAPHASQHCQGLIAKTKELGKELWLYNSGRTRFSFGFLSWKHGAAARLEWAYACGWNRNTSRDFTTWSTSRGGDPACGINYPSEGENIPTQYYEWTKQGIDDYKYVYTLEQEILSAAKGSAPAAREAENAQRMLENIKAGCPEYSKSTDLGGKEQTDMAVSAWRKQIIEVIEKLRGFSR